MFHKKRDQSSLKVKISTYTFTTSCFIKAVHLSDKLSLTCPRLLPVEDICIGVYVLKHVLNVQHILDKVVSMQHSFKEFSEKQRRVELKSVGNFVATTVLVESANQFSLEELCRNICRRHIVHQTFWNNLNFIQGNLILFDKIPVSTIKLPQWRFQAFLDVSLFEKFIWKPCRPQKKKPSFRGSSPDNLRVNRLVSSGVYRRILRFRTSMVDLTHSERMSTSTSSFFAHCLAYSSHAFMMIFKFWCRENETGSLYFGSLRKRSLGFGLPVILK